MSSYSNQYRPVATVETAVNDAMSVRVARDLAAGINNSILVGAPRISDAWPESSAANVTNCRSLANTSENVILMWPGVYVGVGLYNLLEWTISGVRDTGADNITWTLYAGQKPYRGSTTAIDATDKATFGGYKSDSLVVNSGTINLYVSSGNLKIVPSPQGYIYPMLTATGTATSRASLFALSITAWRTDA